MIGNLLTAIEAGGDSRVLAAQLARREAERDAMTARLAQGGGAVMTKAQIEAILQALGGIGRILRNATTTERAAIYQSLGVQMKYDDRSNQVFVTADLARVAGGVGGGTSSLAPPPFEITVRRPILAA
jgi:hypothetical protein